MDTIPHIIFNPVAGGGRAKKNKNLLISQLDNRFGKRYRFMETSGPGDAIRLARKASLQGADLLIAVGGDGTIHEVINGMSAERRLPNDHCELGILNCGSGGGLAQTLGLPDSLGEQLDLICTSSANRMDLGIVTYHDASGRDCERLFISECQVGIGGSVVSRVGMGYKRFGGTIAFGSVALSHLFHYRASVMTVTRDDQSAESMELIGVVIGNGIYCAGGMKLTPGSRTDDGWLDLLQIHEMGRGKRMVNFSRVYSGRHILSTGFSLYKIRKISMNSDRPVWIEADGELLGKTPCTAGIIPGAIKIRYNESNCNNHSSHRI